jgi:hypothetical protein
VSARSYQAEATRLRAQMRAAEEKAKALGDRLVAAEKRLSTVTSERDALRSARYAEERDAGRLREVMADESLVEEYRRDAWQDLGGLESGEDPPAAGWPDQVADPELFVAQALGLARVAFAPRAAPPSPQTQVAADPDPIETRLGPERAELHRSLLAGGASNGKAKP